MTYLSVEKIPVFGGFRYTACCPSCREKVVDRGTEQDVQNAQRDHECGDR